MNTDSKKYLIIGGTSKAGTTSLYKYLSDHPDIAPSKFKETRFFLDEEYNLPKRSTYNGMNLDEYESYFSESDNSVQATRLEATPDYLYSGLALKIPQVLPQAKILFVLRDPVERMRSWYLFAIQRGFLNQKVSFEEYIDYQISSNDEADLPIHYQALEQCKYQNYIPRFKEVFGQNCLVLDFADLRMSPLDTLKHICEWAGLEHTIYNTYNFGIANKTKSVANPKLNKIYNDLRRKLAYRLKDRFLVGRVLSFFNKKIKKIIFYKSTDAKNIVISEEYAAKIREYVSR